jgi:hypothetical protein
VSTKTKQWFLESQEKRGKRSEKRSAAREGILTVIEREFK